VSCSLITMMTGQQKQVLGAYCSTYKNIFFPKLHNEQIQKLLFLVFFRLITFNKKKTFKIMFLALNVIPILCDLACWSVIQRVISEKLKKISFVLYIRGVQNQTTLVWAPTT
jgi:hypothetical protein